MHRTIEALYKDGRIIPLGEMIPVSEAKVLVTFLDEKRRRTVFPGRKKTLKLKTYLCGGKLRDFTRESVPPCLKAAIDECLGGVLVYRGNMNIGYVLFV